MQYLDIKTNSGWKANQLIKYFLLVLACLLIWFLPATHATCKLLDEQIFRLLNNSLTSPLAWGYFWAYLNHNYETTLNLFLMFGINAWLVFAQPGFRRPKVLAAMIYFWVFFECIWLITHFFGSDLLEIHRLSPSIALQTVINIGEVLKVPNVKISSSDCFPAGHALVLIFWAKFSVMYSKPWLQKFIIAIAILLSLPRLFTGAHWASDVIFTACYILFWFEVAIGTPLYAAATKKLEKFCKFADPQQHAIGAV